MSATVGSALAWWARTQPEKTALVVDGESLDYQGYESWSSRVAVHLRDAGVTPGDRVGLLAENSLPWAVMALGIIKAGAVLVPLNSRFKPAELRTVANDSGLVRVIASDAVADVAREAAGLGDPFAVTPFADVVGLQHAAADAGVDAFRIDRDATDPIAVLFTSGSTGRSKGVVLTNQSLLSIVFEASLTEEGFRQGSTSLLVLPLAFTPGLVWGVLMTTVLGGKIVIEKDLVPGRAVRLMEEHRAQAIFGVPLIFEAFSRTPEFAEADLSSLVTAIVGGAAVPIPLLEAYAAKGVTLRQIYGMTEAGGVATATLRQEAKDHPGSCGYGSIFTELKVVDADGVEVGPEVEGEILIKGPGVTPGYWGDPETTADVITEDGWLRSGDIGRKDADGRIAFADRLKDLIITGGINVSPIEIERVLMGLDGVAEVSVIPAKDEKFGETPAAIITPSSPDLTEADVVAHCERLLSDFKIPRYVVLRQDPLPRLPSGKIAKPQIKEEYVDVHADFEKVR